MKEQQVIAYVCISICSCKYGLDGSIERSTSKLVKQIRLPKWLYRQQTNQNRIQWILARYQYLNRRLSYYVSYSYYDKKTNLDMSWTSALSKVSNAKGNLTRWSSILRKFHTEWQPTLLCQKLELDERYIKGLQKLHVKQCLLRDAEFELQQEKERLHLI